MKKVLIFFGAFILFFFMVGMITYFSVMATPSTKEETKIKTIKYEVVKEHILRYDDAPSYWILVNKKDYKKSDMIKEMKLIVDDMVRKHGSKIGVNIFDTKEALNLDYKFNGLMADGRLTNDKEDEILKKHYLISFEGELETMIYLNTISTYPSSLDGVTSEYNPN